MNQPGASPYKPIKDRAGLIERMTEIAAPDSPAAEREWASRQLDSLWTPSMPPLPVQVGSYVFRGFTGGFGDKRHDNLQVMAADDTTTGLKYRPQPWLCDSCFRPIAGTLGAAGDRQGHE